MPETLIESEFFGHEKGAFTGALSRRLGRFELAHGGTLLLDEVSEIHLSLQAKLLRATQELEFERIGGTSSIQVDVRLISTSNRIMKEAIAHKLFREDLYYRLNVIPVHLPALRERKEDIVPLARYFLEYFCMHMHQPTKQLAECACQKLLAYHFPGNIRELANVMERAVVMSTSEIIYAQQLHLEKETSTLSSELPVGITLEELEKRLILATLEKQAHHLTNTAKILGISLRTLRNKLSQYNNIF